MFATRTSYTCASDGEYLHIYTHADMNTYTQMYMFCICMFCIYVSYICASGGEHLHVYTHTDMNTYIQMYMFCIYMFCIHASYVCASGGEYPGKWHASGFQMPSVCRGAR